MSTHIPIDTDKIAAFCRRWRITEFALFGQGAYRINLPIIQR